MAKIVALLFLSLFTNIHAQSRSRTDARAPVDYVSPNIGGIGQLLKATVPYVQYPHGMARLAPITTPGIVDRYLADKIYGFPVGPAMLMAVTGPISNQAAENASDFDHDFEVATPYYYSADLLTWKVKAEFTATSQAAYYRFTFPSGPAHLVFSVGDNGVVSLTNNISAEGSQKIEGPVGRLANDSGETREYFYAEISQPAKNSQTLSEYEVPNDKSVITKQHGIATSFSMRNGGTVEVRFGLSYISVQQARRNLNREIPRWGFEEVKRKTRAEWNAQLSKIKVTGGTDEQRVIFYTALYRSLGRMTDITEDGRYYSGFDHSVHQAEGHDFYVDDGLWDTYRSLHPLQLLLDSDSQQDMVRSYLRMYEQSGWLPSFPSVAGEQAVMIGHHAAPFILDTYMKGYRDFDVEEAYEALRKNATEATMIPWKRGPLTALDHDYFDKGFFPALAYGETETSTDVTVERRQATSVTIENSYDDWCVAELAKALGKEDDYQYFSKLALNYKNVFNPAVGMMTAKSADGKWVQPFDPKLGGGQGGRDYFTEVDSWLYTFAVQQDPAGLIQLMGGRDRFNFMLDHLFTEQYGTSKWEFLGQFPDATGLVGLYAQGNEPSFHVPYLYDFSGEPWKTQRRVRQLLDVWYGDSPLGIPGDDDGGETSSWYVLSALGFYPVCPGSPIYEIGSPIFESSEITMRNGKVFAIIGHHVSAQNKYIQSATLNGKPLNEPWFAHKDISSGGTLVLEMGSHPNLQWGSAPQDAPPSMSSEIAPIASAR